MLMSQLDFPALNRAITNSLVKVFTAEEIKAMADFYGSPAGKSAMNKSGAYMTDLRPALEAELAKAQAKAGLSQQIGPKGLTGRWRQAMTGVNGFKRHF